MSDRPAWEGSASKRRQVALIARLGTPLVGALGRTWRYTSEGAEAFDQCLAAGQRPILALWHGRILPATPFWRDRGIVAIGLVGFTFRLALAFSGESDKSVQHPVSLSGGLMI